MCLTMCSSGRPSLRSGYPRPLRGLGAAEHGVRSMETIGKLEVARRSLVEAIRLFFDERDAVAIHTLAAAAHEILRDISRHRGIETGSILHDNPEIPESDRKHWYQALNAPTNFFKHADRDPEGILEFDSEENVNFLLASVLLLVQVDTLPLHEANVFLGWITTRNPELRGAVVGDSVGEYCVRNNVDPADFFRFLELLDSQLIIEPLVCSRIE